MNSPGKILTTFLTLNFPIPIVHWNNSKLKGVLTQMTSQVKAKCISILICEMMFPRAVSCEFKGVSPFKFGADYESQVYQFVEDRTGYVIEKNNNVCFDLTDILHIRKCFYTGMNFLQPEFIYKFILFSWL